MNSSSLVKIALAIFFFICLVDMPYGYYQLVRFVALIGFILLAYESYEKGNNQVVIIYVGLAILFQPIFKIALGREVWNIIDVVVGVGLIGSLLKDEMGKGGNMSSIILICLSIYSCNKSPNSRYNRTYESEDEYSNQYKEEYESYDTYYSEPEEEDYFSDGTYTADVYYYNYNTGYGTNYTLDVEVYDNYIVTIYFPNGGYIDVNDFPEAELDEDGYSYILSYDNKSYEVYLWD